MTEVQGKWCIVTGAGRGIGRAIAESLAAKHAKLVLTARSAGQLEETAASCKSKGAEDVLTITADMADAANVEQFCQEVTQKCETIYVLVNNAGISGPQEQSPLAGDPDEWEKVMAVNVSAPMRITRHIAPIMVERKEGVIINIASVASIYPMANMAVYATSKHALRGWSLSCYEALREHHIKVVTIMPGFVATDMTKGAQDKGAEASRMIQPDDIARSAMLAIECSPSCVPSEMVIRPVAPVYSK